MCNFTPSISNKIPTPNPESARSYFECAPRISEEIGAPVLERKSYGYLDQLREYLFIKQSRGEESSFLTLSD